MTDGALRGLACERSYVHRELELNGTPSDKRCKYNILVAMLLNSSWSRQRKLSPLRSCQCPPTGGSATATCRGGVASVDVAVVAAAVLGPLKRDLVAFACYLVG